MQITFLFYDGMTALDAVGPHEILAVYPMYLLSVLLNRQAKLIQIQG